MGSVLKGAIVNITCGTEFWVQMAGNSAKINASTKVCTENMKEAPEVGTFCAVVLGELMYHGNATCILTRCKTWKKLNIYIFSSYIEGFSK